MPVLYTTSAFLGSTLAIGKSPPPIFIAGRGSLVMRLQLSPPSSERKKPSPSSDAYVVGLVVATVAYKRLDWLGAIATLICTRSSGNPFVSFRQVLPPSVDLKSPPVIPSKELLSSHGPRRDCHNDA